MIFHLPSQKTSDFVSLNFRSIRNQANVRLIILFLRGVGAILFEENCIFCYALLCISNTYKTNTDVSKFFYRGLLNLRLSTLIQRKRAIRSKGDLWTFDGFQAKPLWKLEVLQKLLVLSFLHLNYKNTQLLFFCDSVF